MTEDISMKTVTMVTVVAVLLNAMMPTLARAAIYLQEAEVNANTLVRDAYVQVTYRDHNDQKKTERGWIDAVDETTFVIREGGFRGKKIISYDKVLSLIMSDESTVSAKQMNEVNRFIREIKKREIEQNKKEKEAKEDQTVIMSQGQIDFSKIRKGWYAHVIYKSEGVEETVTGRITRQDSAHIVIRVQEERALRILKTILYSDMDTLVIAQHPQSIEKWKNARQVKRHQEQALWKLNQKTVTIMPGGQIDHSKITKGWYAHVVCTSTEGAKKTETGQIVNKDSTHIFVKDRIDRITTWTIAYDDIDTLVVAKQWLDIERYRESGARYNTKVRFKAPSVSKRWMIGRLVAVMQDTLIIQRGSRFYQLPHSHISNLEVSIGQYRNIDEGFKIGLGAGAIIIGCTSIYAYKEKKRIDQRSGDTSLQYYGLGLLRLLGYSAGVLVCLISTLGGATSKSDKWVEVSPDRLNLSLAPTSSKGLRAALTFNF